MNSKSSAFPKGIALRLTASERLPAESRLALSNSGTIELNGFTQTFRGLTDNGNVHLGAGTLRLHQSLTNADFSGQISGAGTVEILATDLTEQRFLSPNTYTGPTILRSSGKLALESNDALGPNPHLTIESGGLVTVDSADLRITTLAGEGTIHLATPSSTVNIDNFSNLALVGLISGPGNLEKNGFGQVALNNMMTYSGETRVRQGILFTQFGIPNSEVTIDAGAQLITSGTIASASVSGTLQPSLQAAGLLVVNGALTFESGAKLRMAIQDWNSLPGTGHNVIDCALLNFNSDATNPVAIDLTLPASLFNFEEAPRVFKLVRTAIGVINNFQLSSNVVINCMNNSSETLEGTWSLRVVDGDLEAVYTPDGFSGFEAWLADYDLGLLTGPNDDPDNDGIPNLIEFIIGGNPQNVNDSDKLPTSTVDATHIEFIFRRSTASAYLNPAVRHGIDLVTWDTAVHNENGVTISSQSDPHDPEIDLVTVRIPRDSAPRRFAQLFASLPSSP